MKVDKLVDIYRNCGFTINKIYGYYFLNREWLNYSFPQTADIQINGNLINYLKWRYPLTIIKADSRIKNTYEFVLETNEYNFEQFATKIRYIIKRSLKECEIKTPSLEDLYHFGLKMNQETIIRHRSRAKYLSKSQKWRKYISSFYSQEDIFILGAYIKNRMVGYLVVQKIDEIYYITDSSHDTQVKPLSPTKALIYKIINQIIEKEGTIKISYGMDSFNPLNNLNRHKEYMLFRRVPATRVYVINPLLLFFLKLTTFLYIHVLKHKKVEINSIRKVISLIQGNRILTKMKL